MAAELPCFLYRITDNAGDLLYVGVTRNVALRVGQHGALQPWWDQVADIAVEVLPDRTTALRAEAEAIRREAPRYNVVHSDRPRTQRALKAAPTKRSGRTWRVEAVQWAHGWELHIADAGVTQVSKLSRADRIVRDYLQLDQNLTREQAAELNIEITIRLLDELQKSVDDAREATRRAAEVTREVAVAQRAVARKMRDDGLSGVDVAFILGVSPQRVSQLVNSS